MPRREAFAFEKAGGKAILCGVCKEEGNEIALRSARAGDPGFRVRIRIRVRPGIRAEKDLDPHRAVNAPNAIVWVDNVQLPGKPRRCPAVAHNVKVHADGYLDFIGPVVVTGNQTFSVNLQPLQPASRSPSASTCRTQRVIVDGADVTGTVPAWPPGPLDPGHRATGIRDYQCEC